MKSNTCKEILNFLHANMQWEQYGKQGECIGDDLNNLMIQKIEHLQSREKVYGFDVLDDVLEQVLAECEYQNNKGGEKHVRQQTVEGHLLVLQSEIKEAINGWMKNSTGRNSVESEIVQNNRIKTFIRMTYEKFIGDHHVEPSMLTLMRVHNEVPEDTLAQHLRDRDYVAIIDAVKYCNHYMAFPVSRGNIADAVIPVDELTAYAERVKAGTQ